MVLIVIIIITGSVQDDGEFLPNIILLTLCYCFHWGTRLNLMNSFRPDIPNEAFRQLSIVTE